MGTSLKHLSEAVPTSTQIVCIRAKYENQITPQKTHFFFMKVRFKGVYTHFTDMLSWCIPLHTQYIGYTCMLFCLCVCLSIFPSQLVSALYLENIVSHNTLLKQKGTCQAIACKFFEEFYSDDIIRIIVPAL